MKEDKDKLNQNLTDAKDNLKWMTQQKNDLEGLVKQLRNDIKGWEIKYEECEKNCEYKIKNKELKVMIIGIRKNSL